MKVTLHTEIGQKTYEALKNLVDNSWYMQDKMGVNGNNPNIIRECCTIKMQTARQTGHSHAIARLCCEYFNNAIMMSPNNNASEYLQKKFLSHLTGQLITTYDKRWIEVNRGESNYYFTGLPTTHPSAIQEIKPEAIFVDCASFYPQKNVPEIIQESLSPIQNFPFFLILVQ